MSKKIFSDENYSFNFMPLLDAIFLLTIFFILTVTLEKEERLLPLELPVTDNPTLSKLESAIIIEVDRSGSCYFEQQKQSLEKLERAIARVRTEFDKDVLLIRAAEGVDVQNLLRLTDLARRVGIEKVSLAVREIQ